MSSLNTMRLSGRICWQDNVVGLKTALCCSSSVTTVKYMLVFNEPLHSLQTAYQSFSLFTPL